MPTVGWSGPTQHSLSHQKWLDETSQPATLSQKHLSPIIVHGIPTSLSITSTPGFTQLKETINPGCSIPLLKFHWAHCFLSTSRKCFSSFIIYLWNPCHAKNSICNSISVRNHLKPAKKSIRPITTVIAANFMVTLPTVAKARNAVASVWTNIIKQMTDPQVNCLGYILVWIVYLSTRLTSLMYQPGPSPWSPPS